MVLSPTVLVIDDEEIMREVITKLLQDEGHRVIAVPTAEEGLEKIKQETIDLVLLDLMLPGMGGLSALENIIQLDTDIVVVMITAYASIENAVTATRLGAYDFLTKPFKNDELLLVIKNGLKKRSLEIENRQLKKTIKERYRFDNIVGKSDQMQKVFDLIAQVGPRRSTILIAGESGTGKELVAKAIHNCSTRANGPFVAVNSGTIPSDLLESELFGHVKGAFTGATSTKRGLFELANEGTIFLDEVGTIPLDTQAKLLRVIQEREFRRVGGLENIKVDVRIIAATNIDLKQAVQQRRFRDDLYYRLNVITVSLPPLRDRRDDIALLVEHFVKHFCDENDQTLYTVDQDALHCLMEYDWPGNVRELENVIERAVVLAPEDGHINRDLLPRDILDSTSVALDKLALSRTGARLKDVVNDFEKDLILSALKKTDWNQKKAAGILGVNTTTLNEKLKRLNIRIP